MASLPIQPPITARVDPQGRLLAADAPLLALQEQAGSRLGSSLCVPQLAALARLASRLGVAITRPVLAASDEEDLDLLVRAEPDAGGVTLSVERWTARPATPSRLLRGQSEDEDHLVPEELVTDQALRITSLSAGLARRVGIALADVSGQPLSRIVRPVEDDSGSLPLFDALASRTTFVAQPAVLRPGDARVLLDGTPRMEDGRFGGYTIRVSSPDVRQPPAMPPFDDLLKEPLTSIIGQAEEIAARSEGPLRSDYVGYGSDIAAAARHLLDLLATLGAGDPSASPDEGTGEPLELAELVLDAAGLVQAEASSRGIVLDIGGSGSLPIRGQGRAITQILVNLIGNAVRFSPDGGTVAITLESINGAAVTIADQGPGVAPADRSRIFERFEQGTQTRGGGAGLGLAISRRLARDMGGEVELLEHSGPGAIFRLTLPPA